MEKNVNGLNPQAKNVFIVRFHRRQKNEIKKKKISLVQILFFEPIQGLDLI